MQHHILTLVEVLPTAPLFTVRSYGFIQGCETKMQAYSGYMEDVSEHYELIFHVHLKVFHHYEILLWI